MAALDKVTRLLDQTSKAEDKLEVEKVLKRRTFSKEVCDLRDNNTMPLKS